MFPWNENIKKIFVTYPLALGCIICSLAKGEERERERERDHNNIHDMGTSELIISYVFTGCLLTPSIII